MIEILKSGLYDSIQDLGRFGFQRFGVPYSGAMDLYSAGTANSILGNPSTSAVLEVTIMGPRLKFHCNTEIALSGANLSPKLNFKPIQMDRCYRVKNNDVLSFGHRSYGCRTYLAVKNGFQTELVMNSYSMCPNITSQFRLVKGDQLSVSESITNSELKSIKTNNSHFQSDVIEVFKGMEFNALSDEVQNKLLSTEITISKDSNRMAYQIDEIFDNNLNAIITSLVLPGTIQLTPSGQLLILMRDCQVTGGYPRVFQVTEKSLNLLSQKFFGEKFKLKCID